MMAGPTYAEMRDARLRDPSVYFWVKDLIKLADGKDPLDALYALEDVARLFRTKFEEMTGIPPA